MCACSLIYKQAFTPSAAYLKSFIQTKQRTNMGLFGRKFKASRVTTLSNLAISRIAILKNQHQVRCSLTRSDVIQLLHLGRQEDALHRVGSNDIPYSPFLAWWFLLKAQAIQLLINFTSQVEHVIKEQNTLDALAMMEIYCHLLIEKRVLIQTKGWVLLLSYRDLQLDWASLGWLSTTRRILPPFFTMLDDVPANF